MAGSSVSLTAIEGSNWLNPIPANAISSFDVTISVPVNEGDTWNDLDGKTATISTPAYQAGLGAILAADLGGIGSYIGTMDFVLYDRILSAEDADAVVTIPAASFSVTFDDVEVSGDTTVMVAIPAFTDNEGNEYEGFSLNISLAFDTFYAIDGVDMTDEIDPEVPISMEGA